MKKIAICVILAVFAGLAVPRASAQCLLGACALTFFLQSDASGLTLGGSGTSSATMAFGTMQAFGGSTPTGVTKTVGASTWTVATPFDIKVVCTNLISLLACLLGLSPSYTLTAQLQSSDSINTWKIGSTTIVSSAATVLTSSGTYGSPTAYGFGLTIPFTETAGTISNSINFVAIAN